MVIVNILTKSGTNNPTGRAYYFLRDDAFDKPNYFASGEVPFRQQQFGATYGGPIKKDRIHWFGTYERQAADEVATVDVPAFLLPILPDPRTEVPRVTRAHNLFNKFTASLKPGQFLSLISHVRQAGRRQPRRRRQRGRRRRRQRTRLRHLHVGRAHERHQQQPHEPAARGAQHVRQGPSALGGAQPARRVPELPVRPGQQLPAGPRPVEHHRLVDHELPQGTASFGTHDFKWGVEGNWTRGRNAINSIFNGNFLFTADRLPGAGDPSTYPVRYQVRTGDTDLDRPIDLYAGFIEDNWRVKAGLTVALGVRYDLELLGGDFNGEVVPTDIPY